ncbi:mechanosensitive ion channel protein 1, mitochondrial [Morus notabilis]|uniref:mechanosensitive ion channel protein 1, mitochondrial n=1 Tax=Morus notabilis TaxID=981085 RepID=UPI000CED24DC|nr:mechanosensitive ion channel protein 1, mitochondrial [Morus notabilis]XP_024032193.1 mechanosensitive ion channel protein 1, mitochondrial [Morus notabilis]
MAGLRFSILKSLCISLSPKPQAFRSANCYVKSVNCPDGIHLRSLYAYVNRNYKVKETKPFVNVGNTSAKVLGSESPIVIRCYTTRPNYLFSPTSSNSLFRRAIPLVSVNPLSNNCSYSSSSGGNAGKSADSVTASFGASGVNVSDSGGENDWPEKIKDLWQSAVDAATHTGQKAKEASAELSPHVEQFLDSHPYIKNVVVPVSVTFTGTVLAWFVMPRVLRRFHKYASQGQAALLSGSMAGEEVPYEKSFWGALEDPLRYLITFMAFTQIGTMVAPTTIASQYLSQAWTGAVILSFVWFLHRWKTNVFSRALLGSSVAGLDREKLLALDKISSVGLIVIGIMALAEACGVAVQSILTVGGIGGVATAFAARDILGNVLSGLSMQFSKPFSLGDTIKAGSIEGQVVEMGLTTTSLLNAEKFPVIVPNSLFSSQVIVNKSRAEWRAIITKIPLQINDLDKVPEIANDINGMLRSHSKVFLGKEAPYCFLSRIESSFAELTLGCNLKHMRKEELYSMEQDILLRSVQIIKQHGAMLGSSFQDMASQ